uniref:TonB C-terminal domain-containing protein n=1 Tax=uncultured myxobacterium HF0130_06F04 TaxID=723555 RepID=E7C2E5_9BACT|nr:hypothetical protein [uncultured myxobacterium HF0130_06F04]
MATPATKASKGPGARSGMNQPKVLRACIVQRGKVIEEKRCPAKTPMTIGSSARNTFSVSDPSLPASHELFAFNQGHYELVLPEGMTGQISVDGSSAPVDVKTLKAQGIIKKKGSGYVLPLNEKHRGKVALGELTIIFQFVVPPPEPPAPRLPPAAKGSITQQIDWNFAAILAVSLVIHTSGVFYAENAPKPEPISLETMDDRFAAIIVPDKPKDEPKKKKKPKKKKDDGKKSDKKSAEAKAKEDEPKERPKREAPKTKEEAQERAAVKAKAREALAGKGILAVLGAKGGAGSAVADVLSEGGIGKDLDSAFEGVAGVGVATAGSGRTKRGGGTGEAASIGGLATKGGGKVGAGKKKKRRVVGMKMGAIEADGSLDSAAIGKVVRRGQKAVQACYEKELKRDDSLSGKVEVEVTVGEDGKVSDVYIDDALGSSSLKGCIKSRVKRWRFPKPDGGEVTFSFPFIFSSSG